MEEKSADQESTPEGTRPEGAGDSMRSTVAGETVSDSILRVLGNSAEPVSAADIVAQVVKHTPTSVANTRNELTKLVKDGRIVRPRHGYYRLAEEEASSAAPGSDLVHIPLAEVSVSAGPGNTAWTEHTVSFVSMSRAYIRRLTGIDPGRLVMIVATGDSMMPTIQPGDRLMVAKHDGSSIVDGAIYVWRNRYSGLMVKRARWRDADLYIQGDADSEPSGRIGPADETPEWQPVGRVLRVEKPL